MVSDFFRRGALRDDVGILVKGLLQAPYEEAHMKERLCVQAPHSAAKHFLKHDSASCVAIHFLATAVEVNLHCRHKHLTRSNSSDAGKARNNLFTFRLDRDLVGILAAWSPVGL